MGDESLRVFPSKASFKYDEDDPLGSGAFGVVYKALVTKTGETVALKVINGPQRLTRR